jgi:tetratricopeptide (TPR) repeat protein
MARKRASTVASGPTRKDVELAIKRNEILTATEFAKTIVTTAPTDENRRLYAQTLATAFESYTAAGKMKAVSETLKIAAEVAIANPTVAEDIAVLHAKAGEFAKALELSSTPRVKAHIADLCVRRGNTNGATDEFAKDFATIRNAFQAYEAGQDELAREATQTIGLTSPFLQWRVLLRGLISHANGDQPRAIENWSRLNPEMIPAKLSLSVRVGIDAAYRDGLPAGLREELRQRGANLQSTDLTKNLRLIQKYSSQGKSLKEVWKHVLAVVPALKSPFPKLFENLGEILYHAIIRLGEPNDLKEYRKIFGNPSYDPSFAKLEATVFEGVGNFAGSVARWKAYEAWLATKPAGWPQDVLNLARAKILLRIGGLLGSWADEKLAEESHPMGFLQHLFGEKLPKTTEPIEEPLPYLRRSVALAPNWAEGVREFMAFCEKEELFDEAVEVGEKFVQANPGNIQVLRSLAEQYFLKNDMLAHIETVRKAQAVNPLDEDLNQYFACSYCSAIRSFLVDGDFPECERLIAEGQSLAESRLPTSYASLKAVVCKKRGKLDEANALESPILAPNSISYLEATYCSAIYGIIAKLKPALRKPADERLKAMFAIEVPNPSQLVKLTQVWLDLDEEGIDYRGHATYEKKIIAMIERSIHANAVDESSYERLTAFLTFREAMKVAKKFSLLLMKRFPKNPAFIVLQIHAIMADRKSSARERDRLSTLVRMAEVAVQDSPDSKHQELLEILASIKAQVGSPFDLPFFSH